MRIGNNAWQIILRRRGSGPLYSCLITVRECDRTTEFKQRSEGLGINGVTLQSYRHAYAERRQRAPRALRATLNGPDVTDCASGRCVCGFVTIH
jgi:hypothetical protein